LIWSGIARVRVVPHWVRKCEAQKEDLGGGGIEDVGVVRYN